MSIFSFFLLIAGISFASLLHHYPIPSQNKESDVRKNGEDSRYESKNVSKIWYVVLVMLAMIPLTMINYSVFVSLNMVFDDHYEYFLRPGHFVSGKSSLVFISYVLSFMEVSLVYMMLYFIKSRKISS